MTCSDAILVQSRGIEIVHAAVKQLGRFALHFVGELVGVFIPPFNAGARTGDADLLAMHGPGIDRRNPGRRDGAIVIFHQHRCIVFERRSRLNEALSGAQQPLDLEVGQDHFRDIERVRAQVAQDIAWSREFRSNTPARRWICLFHCRAMEAVGKLEVDDANIAQVTIGDHVAGLLDHLVTRIAIGHADNTAPLGGQRLQLFGLRDGEAQGLFTHDMQVVLQRRLADGKVGVIGSSDGDDLDAVRPPGLRGKKGFVVGIAARCINAELDPEGPSAFCIDVQGARHELEYPVARCG